jgi:hypothetical protein
MRRKLQETEAALVGLKKGLLAATNKRLLEEIGEGPLDAERCADYKILYEKLLTAGDFADLAIHLEPGDALKNQADWFQKILSRLEPMNLFGEEQKPAEQRGRDWERLVDGLYRRLNLDCMEKILARKARTAKRKAIILRRLRRNVAEYCSVVRLPTDERETFTPFMLTRIEGLIAAALRFLNKYR